MSDQNQDIRTKVRDAQKQIIDRLAQCEALLSDLYTTYRSAIPEMDKFWAQLAKEETTHEKILKTLYSVLDRQHIFYNLDRFNGQGITDYIDRITAELDAVRRTPVTALYAVSTALSLEVALIDSRFYDTVTSDAPEFALIAKQLSGAARKHVEHIQRQHALLLKTAEDNRAGQHARTTRYTTQ